MASFWYNIAAKQELADQLELSTDTIKAMLVTSAYTPARSDTAVSTASAAELSGTGYTPGFGSTSRKTLSSKVFTQDDPNNRGTFSAASLTWTGINAGTIAGLVLIKEITNDASSLLIAYIDSTQFPLVTNGGDVTINPSSAGFLQGQTI